MKKLFFILVILLFSVNILCQNSIISKSDIPNLNAIIKDLEKNYNKSETPIFYSLPQTIATYFKIVTKEPNNFLFNLKKSENIKQLQDKFKGLQVDKSLLVIKNEYLNYKKENKLQIKSFEIGKSRSHIIDNQNYEIKIFLNKKNNNRIYLSSYQEKWSNHKESTIIEGFYLNGEFKSVAIPKDLCDWINYTDLIVKPETSIFYDKKEKSKEFESYNITIIDSLVNYYELKTNKPLYKKKQDYTKSIKELNEWENKKEFFADSLYINDSNFKNLLISALDYAEKNKVSNGNIEDFTAQLISERRALELMRLNRQVGTCSFDNGPIIQQKRIASLASKTKNWNVFIKAFLNIMNDNVSRNANSNIASNVRKTYVEELTKLDIDINKILLGSNIRIKDTTRDHYFSNGSKIAKAYANLNSEKQDYFKKIIFNIIKGKEIDAFNKLHFYNTLKNYQYFVKDSIKRVQLKKDIKNIIQYLPKEIKSRIENPNKQLYNLLYREKQMLDNFDIKSSVVANIYSYSYNGDCWQAELIDKNTEGKIIYDLTMPIGDEITPLQNFIDKKNELKTRVEKHLFLQQIINENKKNKIYIKFTKDKSFANYKNSVTKDMPKELVNALDFNNAISLNVLFSKRKNVRFILLNNENLLMLGIPKDFNLVNYKFEELMTKEEKSFFSTSYYSFKLFDKKGRLLN